jgi:uncharacterized phiE125 gp8 family phage protein
MVTEPTSEPVTLLEVKEHLRIDHNDDDDLLTRYIPAARRQAENNMKRQIMPATWKIIFDDFPNSTAEIELPRGDLSTVTSDVSIEYVDSNNSTQTVNATAYNVRYENRPLGTVVPSYGNSWPSDVLSDPPGSVRITYNSGYLNKQSVPEDIKLWIKFKVGDMYECKETVVRDDMRSPVDVLLDPHVIKVFR